MNVHLVLSAFTSSPISLLATTNASVHAQLACPRQCSFCCVQHSSARRL